jgi:hypothetical protein
MCEATWTPSYFYKKCQMPTMAILRVKQEGKYRGPETTTPFEANWHIKSVEKETYIKKRTVLVDPTNEIGSDDQDILGKKHTKVGHPWLHIDEALLMYLQCMGEKIPNQLKQDIADMS